MRIRHIILSIVALLCFVGCSKVSEPDSDIFITSQSIDFSSGSTFVVASDDMTIKLGFETNGVWSASSDKSWCEVAPEQGEDSGQLEIYISKNGGGERSALIKIMSALSTKEIVVTQNAAVDYRLPVIFHVIYKDSGSDKQYVPQERINQIVDSLNYHYENNNANVSFKLAERDPNGNALKKPGIEYIRWAGEYPISCEDFMASGKNNSVSQYRQYIWDPNKYINIMMYNFETIGDNEKTVLGVSHLPYTTLDHKLDSLVVTNFDYISLENLSYAHCISINTLFVNEDSEDGYNGNSIFNTMSHEMGHYLGLHHVFAENSDGTYRRSDEDTDACQDTPSYNRYSYELQLANSSAVRFDEFVWRRPTNGNNFISRNIMDYFISYSSEFTNDQISRFNHVVTFSPLMPREGNEVKSVGVEGVIYDLPARIAKCSSHEHSCSPLAK